jgi:peptide/nickel transport system substrate-binding protein
MSRPDGQLPTPKRARAAEARRRGGDLPDALALRRSTWRVACRVLGVVLLSAGCSSSEPPPDPNVITIAARIAPNNLNPWMASDEGSGRIAELVFDPLLRLGDDLRVKPVLAERLDNPDPLSYIVHLRRGVRFHDGHELTARDVVHTYERILDPGFISPHKGAFRMLAAVTALDTYTVTFTLTEPFAAFPVQLTSPPVVPAGSGERSGAFPVGTGPYRFVRYDVDDKIVLSAFAEYWGGAPRNAGVIVKVVPDDTMRGLELRKGSADLVINDMPPDIVHQLEQTGDFTVAHGDGFDFSYLGFNLRDRVVSNKRVRHAIGYAIDREAIVRYLRRGLARPAFGLIPPQSWAFEPDVLRFDHDPNRARRLLDEAGYPDPDGDGPLPRLRLSLSISTNEEIRLQASVIQEDLRRVGIDLVLRSYEFATFFDDVLKGNFQVFSLQWVGGALADPDILRRVFHSEQVPPAGFNRGYYRNAEVDRLLALAADARNEAERKTIYSAVQKLIAEDAPYIPIWNRINAIIAQPSLDGLRVNTFGDYTSLKDVKRMPRP